MEHLTLREFVESNRDLKFLFTGGKGGVGKTICAAGLAYHFASSGEKVLLASLNPVHSLSSLFEQNLFGGEIRQVGDVENLYAIEVDIKDKIRAYKEQLSQRLKWFLKWADIPVKAEGFVDIAATNPAFEESAMFDEMVDIMIKRGREFDKVVFDCAAVANAVRLLGLSKIYDLWLARMIKSREEALSLRVKLSFRKEKVLEEIKKDPMMADLIDMRKRMSVAKGILSDPSKTAFFFVTLPLALPISVVKRFIDMVKKFDIPVGGVFVNGVLRESVVREGGTPYLKNKYNEQKRYMEVIKRDLWPLIRAVIPLYETEVVGLDRIRQVSEDMFNWKGSMD